jgi:hypothetical protein
MGMAMGKALIKAANVCHGRLGANGGRAEQSRANKACTVQATGARPPLVCVWCTGANVLSAACFVLLLDPKMSFSVLHGYRTFTVSHTFSAPDD